MTTLTESAEFWELFWDNYSDNPDDISELEGFIFRDKDGKWFMAVVPPNAVKPLKVPVFYNPWTGEELR